ncbi:HNH endonuclease signature motif containing protein [Tsukamurella tyrosinosolvens]|uniref:HNH endonuclease signature motif containing protein n=1 Tax=Tsukamurella tyrosinosolvens TaxID=57704 RepID=UPI000DF6EFFE|nr:HNH endonuclease signature motif containing protein [Tsukamurella tyrosinosolvens]RDB48480.1 HNH endonuclease [Tsukamurella tyrosinosolvens]
MDLPGVIRDLPGEMIPEGLAAVHGYRDRLSKLAFEQRCAENAAYCRRVAALYCLYRTMYADAEAELLGLPADAEISDLRARQRDLRLRETELQAQVSVVLRVGASAADRAVEEAVGFVERLPRVFGLIAAGVISVPGGREALARSRALGRAQVREFDGALADRLEADARELLAIPALREFADLLVARIDPEAAIRRRERSRDDRTVIFRPEEDGLASAFALLPAEDVAEFERRVDDIIGTVCDQDSRAVSQRRADGLMMLLRGYVTLGCDCGVCDRTEARAADDGVEDGVIVRYRALVHVVVNERTLADPENDESGYLSGYGPITAAHARDLAGREDAVVREFGERIDTAGTSASESDVTADSGTADSADAADRGDDLAADPDVSDVDDPDTAEIAGAALVRARGSADYRLTADLVRYLTILHPRCVFPLCTRPARRCEIDHSREYDHVDPARGGRTAANNLQPLCKKHHQLKTAGGWIDARLPDGRILWITPDGEHIIVDPAGVVLALFPDLKRVSWTAPDLPDPRARVRNGPTKLQREHRRREQIRQRHRDAAQRLRNPRPPEPPPGRSPSGAGISIIEERLRCVLRAHRAQVRAEIRAERAAVLPEGPTHLRPPEPAHSDDERPPY